MPLSNREIADVFSNIADTMEVMGESRYRIQAYRRAGEVLQELPAPLSEYRSSGALETISGVGPAIAEKIAELLDTGRLKFYDDLQHQLPASALELLRVPNIGPRTAGRLYQELGIDSIAALKDAATSGKLGTIKGFGAKTVQGVLAGIAAVEQRDSRRLLYDALRLAEKLMDDLRAAAPAIAQLSYAGSLRRGRQTVGDLDLLAATSDPGSTIAAFTGLAQVAQVISSGTEKASVQLHNGMQADLIALDPALWGSALHHFTGSQQHNIRFRELAIERGLRFSEHGFARADGSIITCATEEEAFAVLGLPFIPPELREHQGEFAAAAAGTLPRLIELDTIRADLHTHSTWSDGHAPIARMAEMAQARGYQYMAITDHSAFLGVTNGLDGVRLREQAAEVAALNESYARAGITFRILRGVEVDILADGELALPDDVLADLDIVVASPHVSLRQPREQATDRLLRAIRNPHVDIIGHPTGRLIGHREGSDIDLDAVGRAAAETNTLLEINCGPDRLDLDAASVRRVLELGASLSINSDAHHPNDFAWMRLGVLTARRGWAPAERVANTWPLERMQEWLRRRG